MNSLHSLDIKKKIKNKINCLLLKLALQLRGKLNRILVKGGDKVW